MQQRIVRAKRKIAAAGIPYRVPPDDQLPDRLAGVLRVVYLVFNEGHTATAGTELDARVAVRRGDPARAAARRAHARRRRGARPARAAPAHRRAARRPGRPTTARSSRSRTRTARAGTRDRIAEGVAVLDRALRLRRPGPYQLQAAIAALHAQAPSFDATDWPQIARSTSGSPGSTRRRSSRSTARSRSRSPTAPGGAGGPRAARTPTRASTATSRSTPPAPSSCAARATPRPPAPPTSERSRSRPTTASATSCRAPALGVRPLASG